VLQHEPKIKQPDDSTPPNGGFKYNEIVIDSEEWTNNLPHSIEAFFYPVNDTACQEPCQRFAATAHRKFLQKYPDYYVPLLQLDRTDMTTPFSQGSAMPYPDSFWNSFKSDFIVFFPLAFVIFPILVTIISAITATLEKGVHNVNREWTGVWLMCTRFIPYYLFLPTMIAWFGAYAIARSSDLKWGNRPDSTESSGDVIATARILVGLGVSANCILAVLSIYMTDNQTCTH
jgi:hypothetical protein